jgi:hypothetical protein
MKHTYENVLTRVKIAGSYCRIKQKIGLCPSVAETSIFKQRKGEMYCRIMQALGSVSLILYPFIVFHFAMGLLQPSVELFSIGLKNGGKSAIFFCKWAAYS